MGASTFSRIALAHLKTMKDVEIPLVVGRYSVPGDRVDITWMAPQEASYWDPQLPPDIDADIDYVFAFGWNKIIHIENYSVPIFGFHPSLLPRGRGPAPVINGWLDHREWCGSTFFQLTDKLDAGPILSQRHVQCFHSWSVIELYTAICQTALDQISGFIPFLENHSYTLFSQDESRATYYPKRDKDEWIPYW
jgi:methionyl-tRNA formyltransferase